jgi:hypothetical protein
LGSRKISGLQPVNVNASGKGLAIKIYQTPLDSQPKNLYNECNDFRIAGLGAGESKFPNGEIGKEKYAH